jgi:DHA3 family tetracycline resistance protein-like MFS transporter
MNIVGVGLFYGLYSEGFDRLWVKHMIDTFDLPVFYGANQVAFFSVLRVAGAILTILAVRYVEKRVDTGSSLAIGRSMLIVTGLVSAALIGFAISPFLSLTIGLYLAIYILRSVAGPLQTAWVNQKLDSNVRATVHSMFGQVDAIGQVMGGPGVALIARFASVIAAISTSGLLLTPALFLIRRANRISTAEAGDTSKAEATPAD